MGEVLAFPVRPEHDPALTYRQLIEELGVSDSFLRERVAEGMPSLGLDYAGRRIFRLSEVRRFLGARNRRMGRA